MRFMPEISNVPIIRTLLSGMRALPLLALILMVHAAASPFTSGQEGATSFRIGEKLTYAVGFERFSNVAYAEFYTVSRGKIGETEAVELHARVKTLDFVSAAFYLVDESRTIFAAPDSGLPLHLTRTRNIGGLPNETVQNNLTAPTGNYDLVTMLYRIRQAEGSGSFNISENDRVFPVTFQTTGSEKIKTDAGEYDTTIHSVQCDYFTEIGIRDLRINLSTTEAKVPVSIRFRTNKGEFRATLASVQNMEPQAEVSPTPTPLSTPRPAPVPTPTPPSYIDNQPLPADLSFVLGETLDYRLSTGVTPIATLRLQATERKLFEQLDSLLLTATVTEASNAGGLFSKGDSIRAYVGPETLGPRRLDISLNGSLATMNQTLNFDERSNMISFKGGQVESPVGTHSILSLVYAIRSFNLKPSKDSSNPINDTRVAVFWENRPYIFTLRPSTAEIISLEGEKISAQMVTITTQNPQLDALNLKVWLSNDTRRLPLRFSIGRYQADLISEKIIPPAQAR